MNARFLRSAFHKPNLQRQFRHRPVLEALEERCLLDSTYLQTNLVSDIPGMAPTTDSNLKNPWGLVSSPTGPWWVSDNNAGVSTLYRGDGSIVPLVVSIPPPGGGSSSGTPTGIVFNGSGGFVVSQNGNSGSSFFMWSTEDGTIAGWNPGVNLTSAVLAVDNSGTGAVYKGLALGNNASGTFLYATNFNAGTIDVFDSNFQPAHLAGSFIDPALPPPPPGVTGFAPFGIRNINGNLYVTYALQNAEKHDDVAGPGNGFVDVFDTNGNFIQRLISHGNLNSPWGLVLAPGNFGKFSDALLVGNFGDGTINAYDIGTGDFRGQMADQQGNPIVIDGLWSLSFGNGGAAGGTHTLFFTAGINDEADGLFGTLVPAKKAKSSPSAAGDQHNAGMAAAAASRPIDSPNQAVASSGTALTSTVSQKAVSPLSPGRRQNEAVAVSFVSSASIRTAHRAAVDRAFADFGPGWFE